MANRYFSQFAWSLEKNPVKLWGRVTFGAAGAPTLDTVNSKGIKSFTRTSTGQFVVTLGTSGTTQASVIDTYNRLLCFTGIFSGAGSHGPSAPIISSPSNAVTTAGTINIRTDATVDTVGDPTSGEVLLFEITLKNSTAQ